MFLQSLRELWHPPTELRTLAVAAKVSIDGVYKKERESGRGTSLPTHSVRDHQTPLIPAMKLVSDPTHRGTGWLQQRLMGGIVYLNTFGVSVLFVLLYFLWNQFFAVPFSRYYFQRKVLLFQISGTFLGSTCTYQFHVSYKAEGLHCFLYFFFLRTMATYLCHTTLVSIITQRAITNI